MDTRLSFADIRLRPPEFVVQGSLLTFVPVDVRLLGVAIRGQLVDPIRPETRFANLPYRTAAGIFLLCSPFNQKVGGSATVGIKLGTGLWVVTYSLRSDKHQSVDDLPNWLREIRMEACVFFAVGQLFSLSHHRPLHLPRHMSNVTCSLSQLQPRRHASVDGADRPRPARAAVW